MWFLPTWVHHLGRIGIGAVFIWAGGVKLLDPRAFARILSGFDLVPEELLVPVAIGLPLVEFLAGVALIFDFRGALKIIFGLLVMFLAVLGYGLARNLNVDCGCFSTAEMAAQDGLKMAFLRDLGLLLVVLYLFFWQRKRQRTWS
jgi:uncharacterized membrane protein YphA (DoxX/SURF4 family)